jgi:hypothetical protein
MILNSQDEKAILLPMNSSSTPTAQNVVLYEDYATSADFVRLAEYAFKKKLKYSTTSPSMWNRKFLDKFIWRASHFNVGPGLQSRSSVVKFDPLSISHHSFHSILQERYGLPLQNTPQMTLLCEVLSSVSEVYLAVQYYRQEKRKHPMIPLFFSKCQSVWDIKIFELEYYLKKASQDPFSFYRKVVLDMFEFLNLALDWVTLSDPTPSETKIYEKKLQRFQYRPFYDYFDIETFIFYTLGFCSKKSSNKDLRACADLLSILKISKTMAEFLDELEKPFLPAHKKLNK